MEITSFIFGMLTMVVISFVVIIVVGLVKIRRLSQTVEGMIEVSVETTRDIHEKIELLSRQIEEVTKGSISYTDKRIDNVLNRIKE